MCNVVNACNSFGCLCRVFVHASENDSAVNIQVLGLQLDNYVPDATLCLKATQWEGIMANEEVLAEQFQT